MADNLCFIFGETDSYFYNGLNTWSWRNLPPQLQKEFRNDEYKYVDTFNVAVGPNGKWYIGGRRKCLANAMVMEKNAWSSNLPEKLANWLPTCDIRTLRVVFGSGDAYFAWDKNGYCYDYIPGPMAAEFEKLRAQGGPGAIMPRTMAMGHGGSFFFVTEREMFAYDLTGCSASLDQEFDGIFTRQGGEWFGKIKYMSLNAHKEGEYFLIDGQGVAMGKFPSTWDSDCSSVHASIKTHFDSQPSLLSPASSAGSISPQPLQAFYSAATTGASPGVASFAAAQMPQPQYFNMATTPPQQQHATQQAVYSQLLAQKQAQQVAQASARAERQKQAQRVSLIRSGFKLGTALLNTANNLAGGNVNTNNFTNVNPTVITPSSTAFNANVNQNLAVNNAILTNQLALDNAYNAALLNQISTDNSNSYDAGLNNGYNAGLDCGYDAGLNSGYDAGFDTGFDAGDASALTMDSSSF